MSMRGGLAAALLGREFEVFSQSFQLTRWPLTLHIMQSKEEEQKGCCTSEPPQSPQWGCVGPWLLWPGQASAYTPEKT